LGLRNAPRLAGIRTTLHPGSPSRIADPRAFAREPEAHNIARTRLVTCIFCIFRALLRHDVAKSCDKAIGGSDPANDRQTWSLR
jgi:hypothetical protein